MNSYSNIILSTWFDNDPSQWRNWWFLGQSNQKKGIESKKKLQNIIDNHIDENKIWSDNSNNYSNVLSKILYYDQWKRHLNINNSDTDSHALSLTYSIIKNNNITKYRHILELIFSLMPFRHTNDPEHILFCIDYLKSLENDKFVNKFRFTSILKLKELEPNFNYKIDSHLKLKWFHYYSKYSNVLDTEFKYSTEYADMNFDKIRRLKAYSTFVNYIESKSDLMDANAYLFISLSGGVDSMVALAICILYKKYVMPNFKCKAIHINWNQRSESNEEAMFLCEYCVNNGIPIEYRNVNWLSRKKNRKEFENKSRQFRFDTYKESHFNINRDVEHNWYVFLGHHAGDIEENVFMNITKGNNYLNLGKMSVEEMIHEVPIVRPFLVCSKSYIYEFAHIYGIPFFKDTTPDWSMRGNIRRRIFPKMEGTIGNQFHTGFRKIAEQSNEVRLMIENCLIEPYMREVSDENDHGMYQTMIMPYKNELPTLFYEILFTRILNSWGFSQPKRNVIIQWIRMIQKNNKWNTFSLTNNIELKRATINSGIKYYILRSKRN
jgi:tRNA(Ile)-lysidine synthetase-like protein